MKRKADGIALLSVYNDDDEEDEQNEENEVRVDSEAVGFDERVNEPGVGNEEIDATVTEDVHIGKAEEGTVANELNEFLPPPPTAKCCDELQQKFAWFISLKEAGKSFNEELRKSKGYRNPDFLQRAVIHQGVDQLGSCFRKEIFDPHGYDPEDFYDVLVLRQKQEFERKEQERKQNQKVEFVRATAIANAAKMMQQGAFANAAALNPGGVKPEGRSKKSKWDKVEPDPRPAPGVPSQNAIAVAAAQAAILSATASNTSLLQHTRKDNRS